MKYQTTKDIAGSLKSAAQAHAQYILEWPMEKHKRSNKKIAFFLLLGKNRFIRSSQLGWFEVELQDASCR